MSATRSDTWLTIPRSWNGSGAGGGHDAPALARIGVVLGAALWLDCQSPERIVGEIGWSPTEGAEVVGKITAGRGDDELAARRRRQVGA